MNKTLYITIDWLSVTFKEWTNEVNEFVSAVSGVGARVPATPLYGYTSAERAPSGAYLLWNVHREEMGLHVQLGGSALRYLFEDSIFTPKSLLGRVNNLGGRATRLDLAKDAKDVKVDYDDIYERLNAGQGKGTARTFEQRRSANNGNTVYVGSRSSDKFIRLYNKAAERGIVDTRWSRLEIELSGMQARSMLAKLVESDRWNDIFITLSRMTVSLSNSTLDDVFYTDQECEIGVPKLEKTTDREKWIDSQVIGAVCKHYVENPDSEAVERLIEALNFLKGMKRE